MPQIFISYRRNDTQTITGRIYDRLASAFNKKSIFKDVNSIEGGDKFPKEIENAIQNCDVLLIVMGLRWVSANGLSRLQKVDDWVRLEIEKAIELDKFIIPVLINNAKSPSREKLPNSIAQISIIHAERVRDDPDFDADVKRLIRKIKKQFPITKIKRSIEVDWNWTANFYNSNNFTGTSVARNDIKGINFNWRTGVPVINGVPIPIGIDNFSIRFIADVAIPKGLYKVSLSCDNGARVYIDGAILIDDLAAKPLKTYEKTINFHEGQHRVVIEYMHYIDQAIIQFSMARAKS